MSVIALSLKLEVPFMVLHRNIQMLRSIPADGTEDHFSSKATFFAVWVGIHRHYA